MIEGALLVKSGTIPLIETRPTIAIFKLLKISESPVSFPFLESNWLFYGI